MSSESLNLFKPIKVGRLNLQHRISMAPLTRTRADNEGVVPTDELHGEYYEQRASSPGTLLISEATFITERAGGYRAVPGLWSKEQIAGWKLVTDRVHKKGSYIYAQLWALGRAAGPKYMKELGYDMVSSSDLPDETKSSSALTEDLSDAVVRPLTVPEIRAYVQDYAQAAKNAIEAGFDGVEIHSANGYLPDQFLRECCNKRTDQYGGSIENRARFTLEIVDAISEAIGADRVGIRLSPFERYGGMVAGSNTIPQFSYVIEQLEKRGVSDPSKRIAYIHLVENIIRSVDGDGKPTILYPIEFARFIWTGPWIRTKGYKKNTAIARAQNDNNVIIGFGKSFISNPDLVKRLKEDIPLNPWDMSTFYTRGLTGYTDYPFYSISSKL